MFRVIFHLDMDAFYASVEQRDNPQLRGQPVIVGSPPTQRGVVCAASYEARKFGVRSAIPSSTARRLCPQGVFVRPRIDYYREESQHIMAIVARTGAIVEPVSIDEAYLDLSALCQIDHTTAEVLTGLQLPFHTHCDYFLDDAHTVSLHLELPTQEEVIPETSKTILKNGDTKDVRRTESERAMDYTGLAMGVAVFMAAELASYLPTVQAFRIAAFTHRPRIREADPVDSYVLDVTLQRSALMEFGQEDNLTAFMTRQAGRFHVNALGGLDGVPAPSWLEHADYQNMARLMVTVAIATFAYFCHNFVPMLTINPMVNGLLQ